MDVSENAVVEVPVDAFDLGCQTRAALDEGAIEDYRQVLVEGGELPPVTAFRDSAGTLRLSGGYHRIEGYRRAGRRTIPTTVRSGGEWEAVSFGMADNAKQNSVRRTRADIREGVRRALVLHPEMSDSTIAAVAVTSPRTVSRVRQELEFTSAVPKSSVRVGADGRRIDVSRVGRQASPAFTGETADVVSVEATASGNVATDATPVVRDAELRRRLERLTAEQRSAWRRYLRLRLTAGEPEDAAPWRALYDTRRAYHLPAEPIPDPRDVPPSVEVAAPPADPVEPPAMPDSLVDLRVDEAAAEDRDNESHPQNLTALQVKNHLKLWMGTISHMVSDRIGIDSFREVFPCPDGDRTIAAAKSMYESMSAWRKGIK